MNKTKHHTETKSNNLHSTKTVNRAKPKGKGKGSGANEGGGQKERQAREGGIKGKKASRE